MSYIQIPKLKVVKTRPIVTSKSSLQFNVPLKGVVTCATCGSQVSWQLQKGRYYGACQRRDERCKNRKYKYIREDVVQEVVKQELERLLCPSQSILEWVVDSMRSDVEKAADNRAEVEQNTKTRIERIKSMDEALYDDKLAGVITQERYESKHESNRGQNNEKSAKNALF